MRQYSVWLGLSGPQPGDRSQAAIKSYLEGKDVKIERPQVKLPIQIDPVSRPVKSVQVHGSVGAGKQYSDCVRDRRLAPSAWDEELKALGEYYLPTQRENAGPL